MHALTTTESLARHLLLAALRRRGDGPEPTYLAVEAAWEQQRHHWLAVAGDALAYLAQERRA